MLKATFSRRLLSSILAFCIFAIAIACDKPSQKKVQPAPSTIGERAHEALLLSLTGQQCEHEKRAALQNQKFALIRNVDLLFTHFPIPAPSTSAIHNNLAWLKENKVEDLTNQIGGLLGQRGEDLSHSLALLFKDVSFKAPSDDQLWNAVSFIKKDEIQTLVSHIQDTAEDDKQAIFGAAGHAFSLIQSDDGAILLQSLVFDLSSATPTAQQIWTVLDFAQRDEAIALASRLGDGLLELQNPTLQQTKDLIAIGKGLRTKMLSEERRFITKKLTDFPLQKPNEEQAWNAVVLLRSDDFRKLNSRFLKDESENRAILASYKRLKEIRQSEDLLFIEKNLADLPREMPTLDESWAILQAYLAKDVQKAQASLWADRATLASLFKEMRELLRPNEAGGKLLAKYQTRFFDEDDTQKFLRALTKFAKEQADWPKWMQKIGISFCLSNIWFEESRRNQCLAQMTRAGLDKKLSKELLDFGAALYQEGSLDRALALQSSFDTFYDSHKEDFDSLKKLEELTKISDDGVKKLADFFKNNEPRQKAVDKLLETFLNDTVYNDFSGALALADNIVEREKNNIGFAKTLARTLGFSLDLLTKDDLGKVLAYVQDQDRQKATRMLVDGLLSDDMIADVEQLAKLAAELQLSEQANIVVAQKLMDEYGFSLETLTRERFNTIYAYVAEPLHQEAFKAFLRMAISESAMSDVSELGSLSRQIYLRHEADLSLVKTLAVDLGVKLKVPDVETIQKILAYVTSKEHQDAGKVLAEVVMSLVFMGLQTQFTPLAIDFNLFSSQSAKSFFSLVGKTRAADVEAASYLTRLAFGFWTMSSANQCKVLSLEELGTNDLSSTLKGIEVFLTTPAYGFKSWLSLLRRVADDVNSRTL